MQSTLQIDSKGFNAMVRELKLFSGQQTRKIVRAVTEDVLIASAKKTKVGTRKAIKESVKVDLRRPFQNPNGDGKYVLTSKGNLWVSPSDETRRYNWALVKEGVKGVPPKTLPSRKLPWGSQTKASRGGRKFPKKNGDQQRAREVIRSARIHYDKEVKKRTRNLGTGSASFVKLGQILGLPMRKKTELKKDAKQALKHFPAGAMKALRAFETVSSRDNYTIVVSSFVQSALNRKAKGIIAFKLALNGQVKNFQKRTKDGVTQYARQFADRHGFVVQ